MTKFNINTLSPNELLVLYGNILDELKSRGIVRSRNNPVADYSEWLVSKSLGLTLQSNSNEGFDAVDPEGIRYQVKGRRLYPSNQSRQLGVIRNLMENKFDFLIAVLFNRDFSVLEAYKVPHHIIEKHARFSTHQNGHILIMKGNVLNDKAIENISGRLKGTTP